MRDKKALEWALYWCKCYECPVSCENFDCVDCLLHSRAIKELEKITEVKQ